MPAVTDVTGACAPDHALRLYIYIERDILHIYIEGMIGEKKKNILSIYILNMLN